MIRVLVIIAVAGFFMATVCFGGAAALGGREVLTGNWDFPADWNIDFDDDDYSSNERGDGSGPDTSRELVWDGTTRLVVNIPAEIHYTQGPVTSVKVSGPQGAVNRVIIDDGHIKFDRRMRNTGRLNIVMTAPSVTDFDLRGAQSLTIEGYDQDTISLNIAGAAEAKAKGRARTAEIEIAGAGDVDFGALTGEEATVEIAGAGDVIIAPTQSAEIDIAGGGDVTLLTRPPNVDQSIAGAGRVTYREGPSAAPAASATPATPPTPAAPVPPAAPAAKAAKI